MIRCKDCIHWGRQECSEVTRECDNPNLLVGYGYKEKDLKPDTIWVEGDEGWGMVTGPEFGCIHGEAK